MRPFVAFDRDGTLIVDKNYLSDPAAVELLPGAREAVDALRAAGYGIVLVTNQSGVGRGYFSMRSVEDVNARLCELLGEFDGIYVCPHIPEESCYCRKPRPGMLVQASRELGFALRQCTVVGDKDVDVELARNAGARGVLVTTGYGAQHLAEGRVQPDYVAGDLAEAARWIVNP
jgi:histidinol-phosphate phosphatase family protein